MSVSFEGVGQVCATFLGGGLTRGQVVRMTGSGEVKIAAGDGIKRLVAEVDAAAKTVTVML